MFSVSPSLPLCAPTTAERLKSTSAMRGSSGDKVLSMLASASRWRISAPVRSPVIATAAASFTTRKKEKNYQEKEKKKAAAKAAAEA